MIHGWFMVCVLQRLASWMMYHMTVFPWALAMTGPTSSTLP